MEMVLAAAYFPGDNANVQPLEVQQLLEFCRRRRLPVILGCDANAHNMEWGSLDTNRRGECLLEYIISEDLSIHNVGNKPTFFTRVREEALDITISNRLASPQIVQWKVSSEPSMSDHRIVRFALGAACQTGYSKRNPRKTNWAKYEEVLRLNLPRIEVQDRKVDCMALEDRVNRLNGTILDAFTSSCPVSKLKGKAQPTWWSRELSVLRKEARRLCNRAKRTGNWEEYSVSLTKYNKEVRKAKRSSFRTFCENIASTPAASRLHKALARDNTGTRLAIRLPNGTFSGTEQERALALPSAHFPDAIPFAG
ncbi:PREDICTED: uncharacterized protein LOC108358170 [Rhagoletis zephyria]|uniref:uncharacterized protein LOC108358170 n=1 Tax=Rhagoletis zephyria TaxID=28612 RepID=UPI000811971A|nr:PREDICTED: uncharacterized protein LOC108358170 [Rhagoletis zephyria]